MRFETTLLAVGNNTGIDVPLSVLDALGGGKRPLVNVVVNDGFTYRSAVASMAGRHLIAFSADKRAATGLKGGETITVDLTLDTEPRTVDIPDDLDAALAAAGARDAFDRLAPSRRKAHVTAVEGAKAEQTRTRRIAAVVDSLA